jgi:cysteine sulfinate desulfinase/cysteine desulfurase-like protein
MALASGTTPGPQIYLDFNATTPIAPEVAAAIDQALTEPFGNPSSVHRAGLQARQAVERARAQVAALLHCSADEVVFTSGGSESNNHALKGVFFARDGERRPHHHHSNRTPSCAQPVPFS